MEQRFDLHMHTLYCDGSATAEDMVLAAIDMGLDTVGLSGHSFTPFDTSYCMSRENTLRYIEDVNRLKEKYAGRIRVLLGLELDQYADTDTSPYDYLIGSTHYLFTASGLTKELSDLSKHTDWVDVDSEPGDITKFAEKNGMDILSVCELFYGTTGNVIAKTDCDIIGHFDLITKFNEQYRLIDTEDPRYVTAWKRAVDRIFEDCRARYERGYRNRLELLGLVEAGNKPVFEINTGAITKGYRTSPYPAADQIAYIKEKGGILILDSDSHSQNAICGSFDKYERGFLSSF